VEGFSRRALLVRSGVLVGAAYAAPLSRALAAVPTAGLTPARLRTYRGLVRVAGALPGSAVDPGRSEWAVERFAADYAARLPDNQRCVDAVLDAVADVRNVRALACGGQGECELFNQALSLAAVPFTPTIDGDDLSPVPVAV
jgi:hypothetical protein